MKPECYHAVCMYFADGCCKRSYDMDCYKYWLEYMMKNNETN